MAVKKMSISIEESLAEEILSAVAEEGESLSHWLSEAAAMQLRNLRLREVVDQWEAEHGRITEEELDEVDRLWPA